MLHYSARRLGFVFLAAVLITSAVAWQLNTSGRVTASFDSSPPISPIDTPTPTALPRQVYLPLILSKYPPPGPAYRIHLPLVERN